MGLFDEKHETQSSYNGPAITKDNNSMFDWLIRKAEADLGLAQAFAAGENERAEQIKGLETTLVGQIDELQRQIVESQEAEFRDLKSEIGTFSDRLTRIEAKKTPSDATQLFVRDELRALWAQVTEGHVKLESRHSEFEKLGESLATHIRALEEQLRDRLQDIQLTQGELRHFQSEAQSLTQRVGQAESTAWQTHTLATGNARMLEQTADILKREIQTIRADLDEQQRNAQLPESLLKEIEQNLGAKIEEIQDRLTREYEAQLGRDTRTEQLDSGIAILTERLTKTESLSLATRALAQHEASAAEAYREKMAGEFATLQAMLNQAQARESQIAHIETSFQGKLDEWQRQTAQKFMLLENRDAEREKSAVELKTQLDAVLAEQGVHTAERLRALEGGHEELRRLKPEFQVLLQRVIDAESAKAGLQAQTDAGARSLARLEGRFETDIAALKTGLAEIIEQQRGYTLPEVQMLEIDRKLGTSIQELQRQLSIEREGFGHWEKGLRESFTSELGGMQSRLSERQSQIEHRFARLDGLEQKVTERIDVLEGRLQHSHQSRNWDQEGWNRLESEMASLNQRAGECESQVRRAHETAATNGKMLEENIANFRQEFDALRSGIGHAAPFDDVVHDLEETFGARLRDIEDQIARQFSRYDESGTERVQKFEQTVNLLRAELETLKTALDQKFIDVPSADFLAQAIQATTQAKIADLEQKLAEQFQGLDGRDRERAQQTQLTIGALQNEIAALRSCANGMTPSQTESGIEALGESLAAKIHESAQQMAQRMNLLDSRAAESARQTEQIIAALKAEMAERKPDEAPRLSSTASFESALRGLEEALNAKIHELRQYVGQKFSVVDGREAEINELKERSQSLVQRVAQLAASVQAGQHTPNMARSVALKPTEVAERSPETEGLAGDASPATTEKEQLSKLQERMSAEIERVRAELKERSGRWKVRKSAS